MPGEHQAGNTARAEIAGQCQIYASALAVPLSDRGHEQATKCWASSDGRGTKSMKYLLARHFRPGYACVRSPGIPVRWPGAGERCDRCHESDQRRFLAEDAAYPQAAGRRTFKRRLRAPLASSLSNFRRSDRRSKSGRPRTHRRHFDLLVVDERIAAIEPASAAASAHFPAIDLEAHHVWPTLIDMHAHLDKGHIVTRTENPDGSFAGALQSTAEDRTHRWTAEDIKRRMEFGLRCSPQQTHPGSGKLGTHLSEWDHRCVVAKDRSPLNRAGPDGVLRTAGVGA